MPVVALLSTYFENVGDDLIREGILYQLGRLLRGPIVYRHISKSNLLSLYSPVTWLSHAPVREMSGMARRVVGAAGRRVSDCRLSACLDKTRHCDLLVVAGTPLFFFTLNRFTFLRNALWPGEVFDRRIGPRPSPALVGLGLGCLLDRPVGRIVQEQPEEMHFIRRFLARSSLVTVRDSDTESITRQACPERAGTVRLAMCPSVWACKGIGVTPEPYAAESSVLVAYSTAGARVDVDRTRARECRYRAFGHVIQHLRRAGIRVALISHTPQDHRELQQVAREHRLAPPRRLGARDLLREVARSRAVVTWRVHGAMAALSLGVPTLLFRTDSRFGMAQALGAAVLDDREAKAEGISEALDRVLAVSVNERMQAWAAMQTAREEELSSLNHLFASYLPQFAVPLDPPHHGGGRLA